MMSSTEVSANSDRRSWVPQGSVFMAEGFYVPNVTMVELPSQAEHIGPVGAATQPVLVKGPDEELFMPSRLDHTFENCGDVYHSTDGGRSWATLCKVPNEYLHSDYIAKVVGYKGPPTQDLKLGSVCFTGVLRDGTLLMGINHWGRGNHGGVHEDPSHYMRTFITRSTDRGKSWSAPVEIDPFPFDAVGGNPVRFYEMPDGRILVPLMTYPGPGIVQGKASRRFAVSYVYCSEDGGQRWRQFGTLGRFTCESDMLLLPSGRMLCVTRYQRSHMPWDHARLAKRWPKDSIFKQTYLMHSDDEGRTWSVPKMLTGATQQTGCIVRLSDGTLAVVFGCKSAQDQRVIFSYDQGQTWSKTIYKIAEGGMYASSVVLADDTIITAYSSVRSPTLLEQHAVQHNRRKAGGGLGMDICVTRWKQPAREIVSAGGFFEPQPVGAEP